MSDPTSSWFFFLCWFVLGFSGCQNMSIDLAKNQEVSMAEKMEKTSTHGPSDLFLKEKCLIWVPRSHLTFKFWRDPTPLRPEGLFIPSKTAGARPIWVPTVIISLSLFGRKTTQVFHLWKLRPLKYLPQTFLGCAYRDEQMSFKDSHFPYQMTSKGSQQGGGWAPTSFTQNFFQAAKKLLALWCQATGVWCMVQKTSRHGWSNLWYAVPTSDARRPDQKFAWNFRWRSFSTTNSIWSKMVRSSCFFACSSLGCKKWDDISISNSPLSKLPTCLIDGYWPPFSLKVLLFTLTLHIQIPPEVWCFRYVFWCPSTFSGGVWVSRVISLNGRVCSFSRIPHTLMDWW